MWEWRMLMGGSEDDMRESKEDEEEDEDED